MSEVVILPRVSKKQAREYQEKQINEVIEELSTKRKVLLQLPTGGGKTVMFGIITKRYIATTDKSVLIMVHRKELLAQAAKTVQEITGFSPFLITAETKRYRHANVYISMVDSTINRIDLISNLGLVIIDECHIANFNKMHNVFLSEYIIGVTATPISSSKKQPMNMYYNDIVPGVQISELIKSKFLSQDITRVPENAVDTKGFNISTLTGDFDERQLFGEFKKAKNVVNTLNAYRKYCNNEKTIIFNVNIEHSMQVCEMFTDFDYNCKHLDSNSPDRDEILQWFRETPGAILCNVMIATVGFDEPTIRNVILNYDTLSLSKYLQCCGRGGRIINEELAIELGEYEKYHFNIIDMAANHTRFGCWSDDRDWRHIFENPEISGEGTAPVKTCPSCQGILHASKMVCDIPIPGGVGACGYVFERKKYEEEKFGEFIVVTKGIDIDSLIIKNKKKYEYYNFFKIIDQFVEGIYETDKRSSLTRMQTAFEACYLMCCDWYSRELGSKEGYIEDISNSQWHINRCKNYFYSAVKKFDFEYYDSPLDKVCSLCGTVGVDCTPNKYGSGLICQDCKTSGLG